VRHLRSFSKREMFVQISSTLYENGKSSSRGNIGRLDTEFFGWRVELHVPDVVISGSRFERFYPEKNGESKQAGLKRGFLLKVDGKQHCGKGGSLQLTGGAAKFLSSRKRGGCSSVEADRFKAEFEFSGSSQENAGGGNCVFEPKGLEQKQSDYGRGLDDFEHSHRDQRQSGS